MKTLRLEIQKETTYDQTITIASNHIIDSILKENEKIFLFHIGKIENTPPELDCTRGNALGNYFLKN